jgi:hypothetical protein
VRLVHYTPAEQQEAAAALRPDAPPVAPILRRMVEDYGDLRAQVRAAAQ